MARYSLTLHEGSCQLAKHHLLERVKRAVAESHVHACERACERENSRPNKGQAMKQSSLFSERNWFV